MHSKHHPSLSAALDRLKRLSSKSKLEINVNFYIPRDILSSENVQPFDESIHTGESSHTIKFMIGTSTSC